MRLLMTAGLVVAGLVLGNCSSSTPSERCEAASEELLDFIGDGAVRDDGEFSLTNGYTVRSDEVEDFYFVAARIDGPDTNGAVGVWTTTDLNTGHSVFSVNDAAQEFTIWGDASETSMTISMSDDGAGEAEGCAKG